MAITKKRKGELVADYVDLLRRSQGLVMTEYRGLPMPALDAVRSRVRGTQSDYQGEYHVTKNTLLEVALQEVGWTVPTDLLTGPTAVAFSFVDIPVLAKALLDYAKDNEKFVIKGGLLPATVLNPAQIKRLSELPPRDVLLAQIVGAIQGPMSQIVGLLTAPMRDLAYILQAHSEQHQSEAQSEGAPAETQAA